MFSFPSAEHDRDHHSFVRPLIVNHPDKTMPDQPLRVESTEVCLTLLVGFFENGSHRIFGDALLFHALPGVR